MLLTKFPNYIIVHESFGSLHKLPILLLCCCSKYYNAVFVLLTVSCFKLKRRPGNMK